MDRPNSARCLFRRAVGRLADGTQTVYRIRSAFRAVFVQEAPSDCTTPRHRYHLVYWQGEGHWPEWIVTTASERLLATLVGTFGQVAAGFSSRQPSFVILPRQEDSRG